MKKLIIALLVTAIGIVAVFGQTSFKEESVTDVKVQGNKVYFYKETVADSVMCTNTGSKCVIGRTTTLNAEIFEMTPRIEKISKKISTQQWLVMYQTGFFPETSITRGYCTSNGPYATAEIRDSIEKPKSKNGLFLSFENFRYKEPFLNKKTSKITEIEERKDYLLFVNRTLLGIIFWVIGLFFFISAYREDTENPRKPDNFGGGLFFQILAFAFIIWGLFKTKDHIFWDSKATTLLFITCGLSLFLKINKTTRFLWLKWYSYLIEFLVLMVIFSVLTNYPAAKPANSIYIGIFTAIFIAGMTRYWSNDHNETTPIGTIWAWFKKLILSPNRQRDSRYL